MNPQDNDVDGGETPIAKKQDVDIQDPADPADPAFFNLTLEARNKIYHRLLDPKGKKTLVVEPLNSIKAITDLLDISPQVRSEVISLIGSDCKARVRAGLYYDLTLEPHSVAVPASKKQTKKNKKENNIAEAAHDLKFWNVVILVFTAEMDVKVTAKMDFKAKTVKVRFPGFEDGMGMFSLRYCDNFFGEFEEAFLNAMKVFTDKEGFDGFMLKDIPQLLHKVEMPCPKYFWDCEEFFGEDDESSDEWNDSDDCDEEYEGQSYSYDGFGEEDGDEFEEDLEDECSDGADEANGEDGEVEGQDGVKHLTSYEAQQVGEVVGDVKAEDLRPGAKVKPED